MEGREEGKGTSRRGFLAGAAGAAGAAIGSVVWPAAADAQVEIPRGGPAEPVFGALFGPPPARTERYALKLGEEIVAELHTVDGGHVGGEVLEADTRDGSTDKHIGQVKYEAFEIQLGAASSPALHDWIQTSWQEKGRRNGAIVYCDYDYQATGERQFFDALITEFGMPALDASSKDAAKMTIKFSPERLPARPYPGGYKVQPVPQKQWLPSNFRLKIDGLEEACSKVNKIEAITIKQSVAGGAVGGPVTLPNLVITLPESGANDFYYWFEAMVPGGGLGGVGERNGTLEYLTSDLEPLLAVRFGGLGIFKIGPQSSEESLSNADAIRRVKIEMYCEDLGFSSPRPAS